MKIAVSASGMDLKSQVDPRFGRCEYLLFVDTDNMNVDVWANEYKDMSGGAGTQTASFVAAKGVRAVLTGRCGPKAMDVLRSENIEVYTDQTGIVQQVVEQFNKGNFTATSVGNSQTKAAGRGMCGGRGMGGGGGQGMGGGRGIGGGSGMGRK
jgi:predicted Fe-Mo cluster-binding NifX family protein